MKYKTLISNYKKKQRDKRTQKRNEIFNSLSVEKQRVAIAEDVIDSVFARQYLCQTGHYIRTSLFDDGDLKSQLPSVKNCNVCAIGATLLSITKYRNKIVKDDINFESFTNPNSEVVKMLSEYFTPKQLALIECTFEDSPWQYNETESTTRVGSKAFGEMLSDKEIQACIDFKNAASKIEIKDSIEQDYCFSSSDIILIEIMKNIINNNGEFIVEQLPK